MAPSFLTQEGYDKLQAELEYLQTERRQETGSLHQTGGKGTAQDTI